MKNERYYDMNGHLISLYHLVRQEPRWAESRLRFMRKKLEQMDLQLANARTALRELLDATEEKERRDDGKDWQAVILRFLEAKQKGEFVWGETGGRYEQRNMANPKQ